MPCGVVRHETIAVSSIHNEHETVGVSGLDNDSFGAWTGLSPRNDDQFFQGRFLSKAVGANVSEGVHCLAPL